MNERKPERITEMTPAFDKRSDDPNKNYGVHGLELRFVLKGEEGAVQFVLFTNWHLPHVQEELDSKRPVSAKFPHLLCHPLPADLGYHSPTPRYEDHQMRDNCPYLDGKPCYYDGSGLSAERVYNIMVEMGGEAMWLELEEYYDRVFRKERGPS